MAALYKEGGELEVGMLVDVYQDPITCQQLEGRARVVRIVDGPNREGGKWEYTIDVKFPKDSGEYVRRVYLD